MAIREQADVLEPEGRIFCRELFARIDADVITGNIIVRRLGDGVRRRNQAMLDIADIIVHFGIGPADVCRRADEAFDLIHGHASVLAVIGHVLARQGIGFVDVDYGSFRMVDAALHVAFDIVGMDFIHALLDVDIAPALDIAVGVAGDECISRHVDRLLRQDDVLRSRSLVQINGQDFLFCHGNGHDLICMKFRCISCTGRKGQGQQGCDHRRCPRFIHSRHLLYWIEWLRRPAGRHCVCCCTGRQA